MIDGAQGALDEYTECTRESMNHNVHKGDGTQKAQTDTKGTRGTNHKRHKEHKGTVHGGYRLKQRAQIGAKHKGYKRIIGYGMEKTQSDMKSTMVDGTAMPQKDTMSTRREIVDR
jgi:hypothetical protein